jgi:uncharacterized membrane protein
MVINWVALPKYTSSYEMASWKSRDLSAGEPRLALCASLPLRQSSPAAMTPTSDSRVGRVRGVDILRGIAVFAMLFYHFFYDLRFFSGRDANSHKMVWLLGHLGIAGTFFLTSGISAALSAKGKTSPSHDIFRIVKLAGCAGLVSLVTFALFPDKWIYCGVLHSLAACAILGLYFKSHPSLCLIGVVLTALAYATLRVTWPEGLGGQGTLDYVPIFPWVGVYFLGIWLWSLSPIRALLDVRSHSTAFGWLEVVGRHSLPIYLIHQPILMGLLWAFFQLR